MNIPSELYRHSLALLTDLYQLTMAYGYWKSGVADTEAVFHMSFRKHPFKGGFSVACGLAHVVDFATRLRFDDGDRAFLAELRGNDGAPLFEPGFLDWLGTFRFSGDIHAIPEGTVVFPHEPLVRVRGPLAECQLLETALLNMVNFQTLVATKAARICQAAAGEPVLEFGLRRAQGIDGALAASRAAYVGGCTATSNVLAGKLFGIPVRGTHAHSWVMSFDDELTAFRTYARVMPNNCVFLVDTYDTVAGVKHAIEVGRTLRADGHEMVGVRLDSGDLAFLSGEARKLLDEAGFPAAQILASNDLDEHTITSLHQQGAAISAWGVGTRLATAFEEPAMGGVYKLTALRRPDGTWQHKVKLSEQAIKVSTPGILQVRRFHGDGDGASDGSQLLGDMIFDELTGEPAGPSTMVDPFDPTRRKSFPAGGPSEDLLVPVIERGRVVRQAPPLVDVRARAAAQVASLHPGSRRLLNPHTYPVGLELGLYERKTTLILAARGHGPAPATTTTTAAASGSK